MTDYVYPQDVLPDMEYRKPEIKAERCGNCTHGEVTNAGAIYPGYHCRLMERLKGYGRRQITSSRSGKRESV